MSDYINELKLELVDDDSLPSTQLEDHQGALAWYKVDGNRRNLIGDETGFDLTFEDPRYTSGQGFNETSLRYQLFTPLEEPEEEYGRIPALLIRRTSKDVVLLGRVTLAWDKLAEWATKLVSQDLKKEVNQQLGQKATDHPGTWTPESMAASLLKELEEVAEVGLNKVYASHGDYLYDLFPNLPWDKVGLKRSLQWLLSPEGGRPKLERLSKRIEERGGPNYLEMFQESLDFPHAGEGHQSIVQTDPRWKTRN